jgi:hypothetical protein
MTTTDAVLLQPDLNTILVSYHPYHGGEDAVSVQFDDREHGRHVVVFNQVADYLATLFATATKSVRIQAFADQMRAKQRANNQ